MNQTSTSSDPEPRFKEEAAKRAVHFVQSGMKVGLGTGSTAIFATRRIAELLKTGELSDIVAFAASKATAEEAVRLGIPLLVDIIKIQRCALFSVMENGEQVVLEAGYPEAKHGIGKIFSRVLVIRRRRNAGRCYRYGRRGASRGK
jgi:hypothetical protein